MYKSAAIGICVISTAIWLAACQATTTPSPLTHAEMTGTAHSAFLVTANAIWTSAAATRSAPTGTPTPSPTPGTPTPTIPVLETEPVNALDSGDDAPYLQDGGAIPPNAMARIGIGYIHSISVYPDRQRVAFSTGSGIYVYRLPTFEREWRRYLDQAAQRMQLSDDGARLTTSYGWEGFPVLFDSETGERIKDLSEGWHDAYLSPDSRLVAVEEKPEFFENATVGRINLYDSQTGEVVRVLEAPIKGFYGGIFSQISWSSGGRKIAACGDESIFIWDAETAVLSQTITADSTTGGLYLRLCGIGFSRDDQYLAAIDSDHAFVVEIDTGEIVYEAQAGFRSFLWGPQFLYVIGQEKVQIIEPGSWRVVNTFDIAASDASISPQGQLLALVSPDGITVIDTGTLTIQYVIDSGAKYTTWSPDGKWLVGVNYVKGKNVRNEDTTTEFTLYDSATGKVGYAPFAPGNGIVFVDDQSLLTVKGYTVSLIDLSTGKTSNSLRLGVSVDRIAWTTTGNQFVMSGEDGEWAWSEESGRLETSPQSGLTIGPWVKLDELDWRIGYVASSTSPDGTRLIDIDNDAACGDGPYGGGCGLWSGKINIYAVENDTPVDPTKQAPSTVLNLDGGVTALTWSPDGSIMAVGLGSVYEKLEGNAVLLIDPRSGSVLMTLQGHLGHVKSLLFSPDGTRLASVSRDGSIIVWNVAAR